MAGDDGAVVVQHDGGARIEARVSPPHVAGGGEMPSGILPIRGLPSVETGGGRRHQCIEPLVPVVEEGRAQGPLGAGDRIVGGGLHYQLQLREIEIAFKSSGYLLNTDQLLGRVQISRTKNPKLVDQTNREGLRDNFEKSALIAILHNFLTKPLKEWMDRINAEYKGLREIDLSETTEKVEGYSRRVRANIKELKRKFSGEDELIESLQTSFNDMYVAYDKAQGYAEKTEIERERMIELAGVGLMVEIVAHELARATKHTLDLLKSSAAMTLPPKVRSLFQALEAQLVTIERRLRVLDPLSVSGRQKKTEFDLVQAIRDSFESRADLLRQNGIASSVKTRKADGRPVRVKAVRGMVVQIVENLLSNSIHWLGVAMRGKRRPDARIEVEVSAESGGSFVFWDNGNGVALQFSETIFNAFYTTRGDEGGRGLGLYIARENARYHGGDLRMVPDHAQHEGRLNAFQFVLTAAS